LKDYEKRDLMTESYGFYTLVDVVSCELTVMKSRFIGKAFPVSSSEQAEAILKEERSRYHDAAHHPYAYRIRTDRDFQCRSSDDGEPPHTAGKPILNAIEKKSITNVIVIIPRYFGGKKLGTGGLSRAYGQCAGQILEKASLAPFIEKETIVIQFPLTLYPKVIKLIKECGSELVDSTFDTNARLSVRLRLADSDRLRERLLDITKGKVEFIK